VPSPTPAVHLPVGLRCVAGHYRLVPPGHAGAPALQVLHLPRSVDDSAWAITPFGALFATDATADTVDMISGGFPAGAMYSAVTPCDENTAPSTCPGPGFPPNYLATDNLTTGALTKVPLAGAAAAEGHDLRSQLGARSHSDGTAHAGGGPVTLCHARRCYDDVQ
jgi:hypothetical protein